jgi:hypothetical protein
MFTKFMLVAKEDFSKVESDLTFSVRLTKNMYGAGQCNNA